MKNKLFDKFKLEDKAFISDILVKGISDILAIALSLVTFGLISRGLSIDNYSVVNQVLNFVILISPIVGLRLQTSFCVFFPGQDGKRNIASPFYVSLFVVIGFTTLAIILMNIFNLQISLLLFGTQNYSKYIKLFSIYIFIYCVNEINIGFFRAVGLIKLSASISFLRSAIQAALFILLYISKKFDINSTFYCYIAIDSTIFTISFIFISRKIGLPCLSNIHIKDLRPYLQYSIPLIPYTVLSWLNSSLSRFILVHLNGLELSGYFIFFTNVVSKLVIISGIIGFVLFPHISKLWNAGNRQKAKDYINLAVQIYVLVIFPAIALVIIMAPTVVLILGGDKYHADTLLMLIICIATLFSGLYTMLSYVIDLTRKTYLYIVLLLVTSVVNILLCFLLVPNFSTLGAGVAMLMTNLLQYIITIWITKRVAGFTIKLDVPFVLVVSVATGATSVLAITLYTPQNIINFFTTALISGVVYLLIIGGYLYIKLRSKKYES